VYIVYAVVVLSLMSAFFNFTLFSSLIGLTVALDQVIGQILQLFIVSIMTVLFARPLLKYASGSEGKMNENIRAVVKRTAVGAAIHVTLTLAFIALLFGASSTIEVVGFMNWYIILNVTAVFPLMMHISISHRDDKPMLFAMEVFRGSSMRDSGIKSMLQAYKSKAIETLETESAEVQNIPEDSLRGTDIGSFSKSTLELEMSKDEMRLSAARAYQPSMISSLSGSGRDSNVKVGDSVHQDQVVVADVFDDTT